MSELSPEYFEYCYERNLMPTDEGYEIWLKNVLNDLESEEK